jgi:hypothetical protein
MTSVANSKQLRPLLLSSLLVLSLLFFYRIIITLEPFGMYDWYNHYDYYDWIKQCLVRFGQIPLYMPDAMHTPDFLANAQTPLLGPLVWLLLIVSTTSYLKILIVFYSAVGIAGMYLLLRDWKVCPALAILYGIAFAFNGFFQTHIAVGHHWVLGLFLLPTTLWLYRKSVLDNTKYFLPAAAINVIPLFEGAHHPFFWTNSFLLLYAFTWSIQKRSFRPLFLWISFITTTIGLGAIKLMPMASEFSNYHPDNTIVGLPLSGILHSLIAAGQNHQSILTTLSYEYGAGWWEYDFYIGPVIAVLLLLALFRPRREWPLWIVGIVFFIISVEWPEGSLFSKTWIYLRRLPGWDSQRCPARLFSITLLSLLLLSALSFQELLNIIENKKSKVFHLLSWLIIGLLAVTFLDYHYQSIAWQKLVNNKEPAQRSHLLPAVNIEAGTNVKVELTYYVGHRSTYRISTSEKAELSFPTASATDLRWQISEFPTDRSGDKLAVSVPPGEHELNLLYTPRYYKQGLALSLCSLGLGILLYIYLSRMSLVKHLA